MQNITAARTKVTNIKAEFHRLCWTRSCEVYFNRPAPLCLCDCSVCSHADVTGRAAGQMCVCVFVCLCSGQLNEAHTHH